MSRHSSEGEFEIFTEFNRKKGENLFKFLVQLSFFTTFLSLSLYLKIILNCSYLIVIYTSWFLKALILLHQYKTIKELKTNQSNE